VYQDFSTERLEASLVADEGAPALPARESGHLQAADVSYRDFFHICSDAGLHSYREMAAAFMVSSQTLFNWRRKAEGPGGGEAMPGWVPYSCFAVHHLGGALDRHSYRVMPEFPEMSIDWFHAWQQRHGLDTYHETGQLFKVSRQAIHNWFSRNRFPPWISRSCIGVDLMAEVKSPA